MSPYNCFGAKTPYLPGWLCCGRWSIECLVLQRIVFAIRYISQRYGTCELCAVRRGWNWKISSVRLCSELNEPNAIIGIPKFQVMWNSKCAHCYLCRAGYDAAMCLVFIQVWIRCTILMRAWKSYWIDKNPPFIVGLWILSQSIWTIHWKNY